MKTIDTHAHVFSREARAAAGARYRPAYAATLDAWRSCWAASGVTHGVVVQPSFFGTDNRELIATLARDPEHLRGVAVVDEAATDGELEALERSGVRALRWNLKSVPGYLSYATPAWRRLLERAAKLGWHLELFVDHGRLIEIIPALSGTAIDVVLDHFGNPGLPGRGQESTFKAVETLQRERNVWVKFSGAYRLGGVDPQALARRWMQVAADRIVWGSDWPWTGHEVGRTYADVRRELERWIEPARAAAILWDNAARLYRFPSPEGAPRTD